MDVKSERYPRLGSRVSIGGLQLQNRVVMPAMETGEMLAGAECSLAMVEMLDCMGAGIYPFVVEDVMGRILPHDPRVFTGHRLERIEPHVVTLTSLSDNETVKVCADWVVLAMGVRPRRDVVEEFQAAFANVHVVGDAARAGRILEATQDAYAKAFVFRNR